MSSAYSVLNDFYLRFVFDFWQIVIFTTLLRRCPAFQKLTLKMTSLFGHCPNVVHIRNEINIVHSTLFNVVNSNIDVHNVTSMLIWHGLALRRHLCLVCHTHALFKQEINFYYLQCFCGHRVSKKWCRGIANRS